MASAQSTVVEEDRVRQNDYRLACDCLRDLASVCVFAEGGRAIVRRIQGF